MKTMFNVTTVKLMLSPLLYSRSRQIAIAREMAALTGALEYLTQSCLHWQNTAMKTVVRNANETEPKNPSFRLAHLVLAIISIYEPLHSSSYTFINQVGTPQRH